MMRGINKKMPKLPRLYFVKKTTGEELNDANMI